MSNTDPLNPANNYYRINSIHKILGDLKAAQPPIIDDLPPGTPDSLDISGQGRVLEGLPEDIKKLKDMSIEELLATIKSYFDKRWNQDGDDFATAKEAFGSGIDANLYLLLDKGGNLSKQADGKIEFQNEFLPVALNFLIKKGAITPDQHAALMAKVKGPNGAFEHTASLFHKSDANKDGYVTREEVADVSDEIFNYFDNDGDGKIHYFDEFLPGLANSLLQNGVLNQQDYDSFMENLAQAKADGIDPIFGNPIAMNDPDPENLDANQTGEAVLPPDDEQPNPNPKEVLQEIRRILEQRAQHRVSPDLLRYLRDRI